MEILQHATKDFYIKIWWFDGVFPLNFGGMLEYFH
jgi:hypothetical protein